MTSDVVREIKKATRRKYSAEQKIKIVLEGLRGQVPVSEICRRENLAQSIFYKWSKAFLESGKNGLTLDTRRDATSEEVLRLKSENDSLKRAIADSQLEVQRLKKSLGL